MHHVETAVDAAKPYLVANHNLHSLYLLRRNPELAAFFDAADLIEVDSTPVITFTRALGLQSRPFHRCTYLDWRDHFWSVANRKAWRVYYLGGAPGVAQAAADQLNLSYPEAQIRVRDGYFDTSPGSDENAEILADIAGFAPHILFVGMGMPRQEQWIVQNRAELPPCAVFSVGAAFDYEAGVQKAAPRWMGRAGFEWLYRLVHDPVRLWRRYCVEPWFMIRPALRDILRAHSQGRLLRRPGGHVLGRGGRPHPVSEPSPVQGRLNLAKDGAQPTSAPEFQKTVVGERPQSRFVDRLEA
jgi:N-acetylglucosaminyldiphosphoundecaprenol N-acetyl-beta-D-mannosaminyltransferase